MKKKSWMAWTLILLILSGVCYAGGDIVKIELFYIDRIKELPETFLLKASAPQPSPVPQIDAEKLYLNLSALREQGVVKVPQQGELLAETGKKNILDTRRTIPGTEEKEGLYMEATPEIAGDGKIASDITVLISKLVELKTITAEGQGSRVIPVMSVQETATYVGLTSGKPVIIGGAGTGGSGMTGGSGGMETDTSRSVPKTFMMLRATRYMKPQVSIEFRLLKNTPAEGFTQTNLPRSDEKVYVADKSEMNNEDIRGVQSILSQQGFEEIEMVFTEEGTKKFAALTEKLAEQYLAIVVDGKLVSAPIVREKITGSRAEIMLAKKEIDKILGR